MASTLFNRLKSEAIENLFEEATKDKIEEGLRAGDDDNALLRRVIKATFADASPLKKAADAIPGIRHAPHLVLTAAAEYLERNADKIWPNDHRPHTQILRMALKEAAPMLIGMGDAGTDMLKMGSEVDKIADKVISSSLKPADRKGMLDELVEMYLVMPGRFFKPERDGAGNVRLEDDKTPVVNAHDWQVARTAWMQSGSKTAVAWRRVSLQDALARMEYVNPRDIEMLRKQAAKPELSKKARRLQEALSRHSIRGTSLERVFDEDIFSDIKDIATLNRMGEDFDHLVWDDNGRARISDEDFKTVVAMFDQWHGAEKKFLNKVLHGLKELAASGNIPAKVWVYLAGAGLSVVGVITLALGILIAGLTLSAFMFINGLTTPLTGTTTFFGHVYDNSAYAFYMSICSGFLAFIITWAFPFVQALGLGWISGKTGRDREWLTSLGQKITAYALLVPTAMVPLGIMAGLDPQHRLFILAASGVPIACGFILRQVNAFAVFEQMVIRTTPYIQLVFGAGLFVFAFVHGWYTSTPARTQTVNTGAVSAWSWLTDSMKGQVILLGLVMVALVVLIHWREKPQNYGGQMVVHPIPARNWILAGIAAIGLYFIFFHEPGKMRPSDVNLINNRVSHTDMTVEKGKSKVRVREDRYEDGTTRRSVSGKVVAPADTPKPDLTKSALCASKKLSEGARERYCNLN